MSALIAITACGETQQQSCDNYAIDSPIQTRDVDPRTLAVPSGNSGPGRIAFVNSKPTPGSSISACGPTVAGCAGRLSVVFSLRPEVDLRSQRLRVSFLAEDEARVMCSSSTFDLDAGQTFAIEVSCPEAFIDARTPFRTAKMIVETGMGPSRIEQDWNVPYGFLP
jgi:hypothetical protein